MEPSERQAPQPRKERIALFVPTLGGGGAERVMATLANGFYHRGHAVDVVLVRRSGSYLNELTPGVQVVDLASSRTLFSVYSLVRYLRKAQPAVLLATQGHANIVAIWVRMLTRLPFRLVVRETNTISVSSDNQKSLKTRFLTRWLRGFYAFADCIIAPSEGVAEDLRQSGIGNKRIEVISNPLPLETIAKYSQEPIEHNWFASNCAIPVILGVGRLTAQKDFPTLLRAFALVVRQRQARLLLLGEGSDRVALEELVASLELRKQVMMPGFVENPFSYMRHAAVYVLSSRWEGLPNALLQALAVGTPVVATDCPSGPREILEGGRWGRLVPVGNATAMADAIIEGLDGQIEPMPLTTLAERYGAEVVTQRYLEVLGAVDVCS